MSQPRPNLLVLFFDVFGTTVAQLDPLANALSNAAQRALNGDSTSTISDEIRSIAAKMTYEQWLKFAIEWNTDVDVFTSQSKAEHNNVDWVAVDRYRFRSLCKLLAQRGLVSVNEDDKSKSSRHVVKEGSLWDEPQLRQLSLVWRQLPPWPDTCEGLKLLNKRYITATLSNTYNDFMKDVVAHSSLPFQQVYTADLWESFKPNPKVYLGAAEKLGVKPEECALVAAHLNDLKGAKACGFYTIYVERPLEEKNPELREANIPDMHIREGEGGFVTLAHQLGIETE